MLCKDRDPLWINRGIKTMILTKDKVYRLLARKKNDIHLRNSLNNLQKKLKDVIKNAKQKYLVGISKKFYNPPTSSKCYWGVIYRVCSSLIDESDCPSQLLTAWKSKV